MYRNYKIVAVTPAGRKRYLEILHQYIRSQRKIIDEYHLWVNTKVAADIDWMKTVHRFEPNFTKLVAPALQPDGNRTIGHFFNYCRDPNTIYVRFDDDILFMHPDALKNLLDFRINNREYLLTFANILNNAVITHYQQKKGNLTGSGKDAALSFKDERGWKDPQFAEIVHNEFFKYLQNGKLEDFYLDNIVLENNERFSINCFAWFGADFARYNVDVSNKSSEENYLSSELPAELNLKNAICGDALVSHFAFYTQRDHLENNTDILQKYRSLIEFSGAPQMKLPENVERGTYYQTDVKVCDQPVTLTQEQASNARFCFAGEFGYELISWIPYLLFLKKTLKIRLTTMGRPGSGILYYFSDEHIELDPKEIGDQWGHPYSYMAVQNRYSDKKLVFPGPDFTNNRIIRIGGFEWKNRNIHERIDESNYVKPDYRHVNEPLPFSFDKPYVVINNKYFRQWFDKFDAPVNYFGREDLIALRDLLKKHGYAVVYNHFKERTSTDKHLELRDEDIFGAEFNDDTYAMHDFYTEEKDPNRRNSIQMSLFNNAAFVIGVQGGNVYLPAICRKNILMLMRYGFSIDYYEFERLFGITVDIFYEPRHMLAYLEHTYLKQPQMFDKIDDSYDYFDFDEETPQEEDVEIEEDDELSKRLKECGWQDRYSRYNELIEDVEIANEVRQPRASVIFAADTNSDDLLRSLEILEMQKDHHLEIIFVNCGAGGKEFEGLKPFFDKIITLSSCPKFTVAANIGAVFSGAPILIFPGGKGAPSFEFIAGHIAAHENYDIVAARGVFFPKNTDNPLNEYVENYYLGSEPFPRHSEIDGNLSYKKETFRKACGWAEELDSSYGLEFSLRMLEIEPEHRKQIYTPEPVIFRDYAEDEQEYEETKKLDEESMQKIREKHPDLEEKLQNWQSLYKKSDELILKTEEASEKEESEAVSEPLISVCIPTYNRVDCLKEALDSASNQDFGDYEIVIVDDGSTDETEELISSFNNDKIRFIKKEHSGAPDTRNRAIKEARGSYILWLDSDDALYQGAISLYAKFIEKFPDVDVFYGDLVIVDNNLTEWKELRYPDWHGKNDALIAHLVVENKIPNPGVLIKNSAYDKIGLYDTEFIRAHDYEWYSRAAGELSFKHIGSRVCKWRWHDKNMSSESVNYDKSYDAKIVQRMLNRYDMRRLFPKIPWDQLSKEEALSIAYLEIARILLRMKQLDLGKEYLQRSYDLVPRKEVETAMMQLRMKPSN